MTGIQPLGLPGRAYEPPKIRGCAARLMASSNGVTVAVKPERFQYPRNLKKDEILIEARILTVADVVEAIASHRPYRPSLGIDAALNEIEKNRGVFYDDAVADAWLRLFREKGFKLEGT